MPVKIDMDMPECCLECPLFKKPEGENFLYFKGFPLGGKCKALPIKDLDGNVVSYQCVNTLEKGEHEKRSKHCPLKECK